MTRICDPTSTDTAQQQIQSRSSSNASAVDGGREAASHHGSGNAGGAAKYGGLPASHAGEDRTPAGGQPGSVLDIEDGFRHVIFDSGIHVQTSRPLDPSRILLRSTDPLESTGGFSLGGFSSLCCFAALPTLPPFFRLCAGYPCIQGGFLLE